MPNRTSELWWLFSRQTVNVTTNETVLNAAMLMVERNFRHLPVITETGTVVGMISAQDIIDSLNLASVANSSARKVIEAMQIPTQRVMTLPPVVVEQGDDLLMVTKKISHYNIGALPIVNDRGVIQGIMSFRDLVALIGTSSEPLGVKVCEVMNTNIRSIYSESTISQAIQLMSEKRVRRLPIVSRDDQLLGILTNRDILGHLASFKIGDLDEQFDRQISQFMSREAIIISQDEDIRVAASRMMIFGVGGLIVDDAPSRIALITERDLIRTLMQRKSIEFVLNAMQFELEARART